MEIEISNFKVGSPNENGRIYSKELVEKAIVNYIKEHNCYILDSPPQYSVEQHAANIRNVVGEAKDARIEGDKLIINCKLFRDPEMIGDLLKSKHFGLHTAGVGTIDEETGIIKDDYKLNYVYLGPSGPPCIPKFLEK